MTEGCVVPASLRVWICGVWWGALGGGHGVWVGGPCACPVGWACWALVGNTAYLAEYLPGESPSKK